MSIFVVDYSPLHYDRHLPQVFPRAKARRESVRKELNALARKHTCLILPSFHTSTLRVVAARPAVAGISQAIGQFIASLESEQRLWVPRKVVKKAIAAVDACKGKTRAKAGEKGGVVLIGSSKEEMDAARTAVLELLRDDAGEDDCVICYGRSDTRLNTCGHPLCTDCGQQHLATCIADLTLPVCCPECDVVLLQEDLRTMGHTSAINIAAVRMFANRTHRDDVAHCRTPDCPQMFDASQTDVTCPVCLFHQCTRCGEASHPGETCEECRARIEHEASPDYRIERAIAHVQASLLAPSCPSCNAAFIDFSGCFALHCSVCSVGFCGYCLASTGSADPHAHVAQCKFLKKHFPDLGSGYWGGHGGSNTFTRCMRVRLAQRVAEYLKEACSDDTERRRVVAGLGDDIKTSPFFSIDELRKIAPTIV